MPRASSKKAAAAAISIQVDEDKATVRVSPSKKKRTGNAKKAVVTRIDSDEAANEAEERAKAINRQALLDNYDAEIQERKAAIEKHITYVLASLKRECASQMSLLPAAVANLTVAEYADVYAFSLDLASRGIARKKNAASLLDAPVNERLERGLASAKKRKHGDALPTPTLSQADPGSPLPIRPAKRPAPVSTVASTSRTTGQTLNRSIRFRATSPPNAKAGPSMHQGFVYRARPSQLDREEAIAKSPVVPSTPAAANGRRPRRHESIQAFSLNGSPLGLLDVERDEDGMPGLEVTRAESPPAPTGDFTFAVPLPAAVVAQLRVQLDKTVMAPADKLKLERILNGQLS